MQPELHRPMPTRALLPPRSTVAVPRVATPVEPMLPPIPRPDRDCCQSGCYGCEWGDAMRAHGRI